MFIQIRPDKYVDHTSIFGIEKDTESTGVTWFVLFHDPTRHGGRDFLACTRDQAHTIIDHLNGRRIHELAHYLNCLHEKEKS